MSRIMSKTGSLGARSLDRAEERGRGDPPSMSISSSCEQPSSAHPAAQHSCRLRAQERTEGGSQMSFLPPLALL